MTWEGVDFFYTHRVSLRKKEMGDLPQRGGQRRLGEDRQAEEWRPPLSQSLDRFRGFFQSSWWIFSEI